MTEATERPDIPKDMARRIRTAQEKVLRQRERVEHAEKRIREETAEIFLFDTNPRAWVDQNYGPAMAIDAYPPITRLGRIKESLASRIERRPVRALEYRDAESNLARIEEEILQRVREMKASKGRVPWPKPLPPLQAHEGVLNIDADVVAQANARLAKEAARSNAWLANYYDDGASPGDGSHDVLAARRSALLWPTSMDYGRLSLRNGAAFHVTAWSRENISEMQRVIDEDQSGGVFGSLWDLACGIILTGCDWAGFREWRDNLISPVRQILYEEPSHVAGVSLDALRVAKNNRYDAIRSVLATRYIPEDIVHVESFVSGSHAMPSRIFRFWKEQGFNDFIARNWFLKSQPRTWVFHSDQNSFGPETWKAMRNVGLAVDGADIPLERGISEFSLQQLKLAMDEIGLKPSRIVTECREALLEYHDQNSVRTALARYGYLQLKGVNPPLGLGWEEFQSWRMQVRAMAGLITDLFLDVVPRAERKMLLQ